MVLFFTERELWRNEKKDLSVFANEQRTVFSNPSEVAGLNISNAKSRKGAETELGCERSIKTSRSRPTSTKGGRVGDLRGGKRSVDASWGSETVQKHSLLRISVAYLKIPRLSGAGQRGNAGKGI